MDDEYREQAEATIADLRARVSHYEARIAEQMEAGEKDAPVAYRWTRSDGEVFVIDPREVEVIH